MSSFLLSAVLVIFNFVCLSSAQESNLPETQSKLFKNLLMDYHKDIPPIHNGPVAVEMSLSLISFEFIDEPNDIASAQIWVSMAWTDKRLEWNGTEYSNTTYLIIDDKYLWYPDIELYNGLSVTETTNTRALVYYYGYVYTTPSFRVTFKCPMDLYYFPYDKQVCKLKFGSWHYHSDTIELVPLLSTVDLEDYHHSADFQLVDTKVQKNMVDYPCCPFMYYHDLTNYLTLHRKPGAYRAKLVMPSVLSGFMVLATFLLPTGSHEKITLCSVLFLCILLLLTYLHDIIPNSADTMIGEYLAFILAIDVIATGIAVVAYKLDATGSSSSPSMSIDLQGLGAGDKAEFEGDNSDLRLQIQKRRTREWLRYLDVGCFILFSIVFIIGSAIILGRRG